MVLSHKTLVPFLTAFALATSIGLNLPGRKLLRAQIMSAPDGTDTSVNINGQQFDISGGSLSGDGANLFHSFTEFGLSQDQIANFLTTPNVANILSRVVGSNPSVINGLIQVTGGNANLFLMNPTGIVFGPHASLNVPASFTATTATGIGFDGGWFSATGANNYQSLSGAPNRFAFNTALPGSILNAGDLTVDTGASLNLIGGNVINTGNLTASAGKIRLMAVPGTSLVRISQPDMALSLEVDASDLGAAGVAGMAATDLPGLLTGDAADVGLEVLDDGSLKLVNSETAIPIQNGTTLISGNIDVSGTLGGEVNVLGDRVALVDATLDASGLFSGGTLLVGGDYQGQGSLPTASRTLVNQNSTLNADALDAGNGGQAIVWAEEVTGFYGDAVARGGSTSGDGGLIEISGKDSLAFQGTVDVSAAAGADGTILFDPENINIVAGAGPHDSQITTDDQILAGDAPPPTFTIGAATLGTLPGTLILQADENITVANGVSINFTGSNPVTFTADADSNGSGSFSMDPTASLTSLAGRNLTISGANITTGNIDVSTTGSQGPAIALNGGTVTLNASGAIATGNINSSADATSTGDAATATGGNVTVTAGTTISTGTINSSASSSASASTSIATAGAVRLAAGNTPGSNISFTSIDATAAATGGATQTSTGGQVDVLATGTVQGTGAGTTIDSRGTTSTGAVTIQHDGGPNNVPFAIGDASQNGLAGSINNSLTSGSFPVLETGGDATGPPAGITLTSINERPTFSLTGSLPLSITQSDRSSTFTLAGLLSISDANSDVTSFIISSILQGTLTPACKVTPSRVSVQFNFTGNADARWRHLAGRRYHCPGRYASVYGPLWSIRNSGRLYPSGQRWSGAL